MAESSSPHPHADYPLRDSHHQYRQPMSDVNTQKIMQIAITFFTLTALPISGWLFLSDYVDGHIEKAIEQHDAATQKDFERQAERFSNMLDYTRNLCQGVREIDPTFSCGGN